MTKLKQNTCYTNVAVPFSSDLKHTENIWPAAIVLSTYEWNTANIVQLWSIKHMLSTKYLSQTRHIFIKLDIRHSGIIRHWTSTGHPTQVSINIRYVLPGPLVIGQAEVCFSYPNTIKALVSESVGLSSSCFSCNMKVWFESFATKMMMPVAITAIVVTVVVNTPVTVSSVATLCLSFIRRIQTTCWECRKHTNVDVTRAKKGSVVHVNTHRTALELALFRGVVA